jgi:tRNA A37 threonylcarbamoyladenosine dehydratase
MIAEQPSLSAEYLHRFGGVGRLFGRSGLERLARAHVCVVGVGGIGSWSVEALARSGVGAITMIDLDDVCVTNTNRQLPAIEGEYGRAKVEVLEARVRAIQPDCRVMALTEFFTESSVDRHLAEPFDYVIDAIDKLANKCLLIAECRRRGLRVITVGGAGGKRDGTGIRVGDLAFSENDALLRAVRRH